MRRIAFVSSRIGFVTTLDIAKLSTAMISATAAKAIVIFVMISVTLSSTSCNKVENSTAPTYAPSDVIGAA